MSHSVAPKSAKIRKRKNKLIVKFAPAANIEETITPLINICRNLEKCDTNQLLDTIKILSKHDSFAISAEITILLRNSLIKLLCGNHMKLSLDLLQEIMQNLPDIADVNDTITQSETVYETDNKDNEHNIIKINNIVQIPSDLMLYTLQYLEIKDLYQIDKCCRYLCRISHNPTALYHLKFYYNVQNIKYWHPRYSRVQRLDLVSDEDYYFNNQQLIPLLPKFKCLESLYFAQNQVSPFINPNTMILFHQKLANYSTLKHVHLNSVRFANVFDFVIKCTNITKLHVEELETWLKLPKTTALNISQPQFYKTITETECPLQNLQEFSIDCDTLNFSIAVHYFIYWILSSGNKAKKLLLTVSRLLWDSLGVIEQFFNPTVVDEDERILKMKHNALLNIKIFHIEAFVPYIFNNITKCCNQLKNIKFDDFTYFFDPNLCNVPGFENPSYNLFKPLDMIVSRSEQSIFSWIESRQRTVHGWWLPVLFGWPATILNSLSKIKMYDMIKIKKSFDFKNVGDDKAIKTIETWIKLSICKLFKLEFNVVFCNVDTQKMETVLQTMTQKYDVPIEYTINDRQIKCIIRS